MGYQECYTCFQQYIFTSESTGNESPSEGWGFEHPDRGGRSLQRNPLAAAGIPLGWTLSSVAGWSPGDRVFPDWYLPGI